MNNQDIDNKLKEAEKHVQRLEKSVPNSDELAFAMEHYASLLRTQKRSLDAANMQAKAKVIRSQLDRANSLSQSSSGEKKQCTFCAETILVAAKLCRFCGKTCQGAGGDQANTRPLAGIAVAGVLGGIGLLWACSMMLSSLTTEPAGVQREMFLTFPGFQGIHFMANSIQVIGNTGLVVGTFMSYWKHPSGGNIVRMTSWAMLASVIIGSIIVGSVLLNSSAWPSLNDETKGGLLGGVVGACIGGAFQWGLILYLFRQHYENVNQVSTSIWKRHF